MHWNNWWSIFKQLYPTRSTFPLFRVSGSWSTLLLLTEAKNKISFELRKVTHGKCVSTTAVPDSRGWKITVNKQLLINLKVRKTTLVTKCFCISRRELYKYELNCQDCWFPSHLNLVVIITFVVYLCLESTEAIKFNYFPLRFPK